MRERWRIYKSSSRSGPSKWGYGLKMFVQITARLLKEMAEMSELLNGTKLAVMAEGRPLPVFPAKRRTI